MGMLIHDPGQHPIAEIAAAVEHLRADGAAAGVPTEVAAATSEDRSARSKQPRARGRLTPPDHLDIVEEQILPPHGRVDADGTRLVPIGVERCVRLDWGPGRFLRHVTLRTRYGRVDTREPSAIVPVPPAIVPRGIGADRLVLHIAHQKYGLGSTPTLPSGSSGGSRSAARTGCLSPARRSSSRAGSSGSMPSPTSPRRCRR